MNWESTDWTRVFGVIPPKLNPEKSCPCKCHGVLRNIAGTVVIDGKLGTLDDETDYVVACGKCTVAHRKGVLRRRASEAA